MDDLFFDAGFVNQADAALGKVTNAAVEQAAGTAAGAGGKIVLFDQAGAQPAHRRVPNDARADDAAADDEQVERFFNERRNRLCAMVRHLISTFHVGLKQFSKFAESGHDQIGFGDAFFRFGGGGFAGQHQDAERAGAAGHFHICIKAVADHGEIFRGEGMALQNAAQHRGIGFSQDGLRCASGRPFPARR